MNTKLSIFLVAGAFALAACNSPTEEQDTNPAASAAEIAGEEAVVAADATGEAAVAGTEAAATAGTGAAGEMAVAADADPLQAAYEEGKTDAAAVIGTASDEASTGMQDAQVEAAADAEAEVQD